MLRTLIMVGAMSASSASADIAFWSWSISDTGDGDGVVEPGESVLLSLWIGFDPEAIGVSEAGPYAITGDIRWQAGTVEGYENELDQLGIYGDGSLNSATNTISEIHHFQLAPFFNNEFISHNPVKVYTIRWKPATYQIGSVTLEGEAPHTLIYTDDFGERALYDGAGGIGTFYIAPTPTTAAVLMFGLFGWSSRRR